jgi:hypothetical protein
LWWTSKCNAGSRCASLQNLQFEDLIDRVLKGMFHMTLSLSKTFKKIQGTSTTPRDNKHTIDDKKKEEDKEGEGRKK